MSLDFNTKHCTPSTPQDINDAALRDALIFLTLNTGLPEITAANHKEVYARIHFIEMLDGTRLYTAEGEPRAITPADVKRWIGLKTNATARTEGQFLKQFKNDLNRYKKEA